MRMRRSSPSPPIARATWRSGDAYASTAKTEVARVALDWAAIRLDPHGTGFGRLTAFLKDHPDWPSASWLRRRGEEALFADKQGFALLASYFSKAEPESAPGKLALARLEREQGRIDEAKALVREVWREGDISQSLESKLLEEFGKFLDAGRSQVPRRPRLLQGGVGPLDALREACGRRRDRARKSPIRRPRRGAQRRGAACRIAGEAQIRSVLYLRAHRGAAAREQAREACRGGEAHAVRAA